MFEMEELTVTELIEELRTLSDAELRQEIFTVGRDAPDPGQPYSHQLEALRRIESGEREVPPVSGILHYPTGAGKTRVGLELIARTLRNDPEHRFFWATDRKVLIRQTMIRLAELSALFQKGTTFTWCENADEIDRIGETGNEANITFLTRSVLREVMRRAADGRRRNHPWRVWLEQRQPMTLIYDECHQLGAPGLQDAWQSFHESVVAPHRTRRRPWRTIGLSATPVPTDPNAHSLLAEYIFPRRPGGPSTSHDWPFHVFHRVDNDILVRSGVLCPINRFFDGRGDFDLPARLLRDILGSASLREPGPNAERAELIQYALQFNKRVMSDARIIQFLASRIGQSIDMLGKTLVFVPTVEAANRFVAELHTNFPALRGKVAAVHSRMAELRVPGQQAASVHEVVDTFRALGSAPSVLVNVDILTEGFDDPKVQSVVLARLTLSTNRFWQIIGRGTRGPATGGTSSCNVIDPIKLVRLYDYFAGYQPSFELNDGDKEFEDEEVEDTGSQGLGPQVASVVLPPDPAQGAYRVDPELERIRADVARALRDFLAFQEGRSLSEAEIVDVARTVRLDFGGGRPTFTHSQGVYDAACAVAMLCGEISRVEKRFGKDLSWFRRRLPPEPDETVTRNYLRRLRAIESFGLWTETQYCAAEMSGAFSAALQREAASEGRDETRPLPLTDVEQAVVDAGLVIAGADGKVDLAEIRVIVDALHKMFGRRPSEELTSLIASRAVPTSMPFERIEAVLKGAPVRQYLLIQLAEVAAADSIVTAGELAQLEAFATRLGIDPNFAAAVLGARPALVRATEGVGETKTCQACTFESPATAAYCAACGTRLLP